MLSIHTVAVAIRTVRLYIPVRTRDALNTHTMAVAVQTVSLYTPVRTRDALNTHRGCGCTDCTFVHYCSYNGCSQHTHIVAVAVQTVSLYTPVRTRDALNTHRGCSCTDCTLVHSCSYKGCSQHTIWHGKGCIFQSTQLEKGIFVIDDFDCCEFVGRWMQR